LGNDPDTAAGAPAGPPTPWAARRSRQSEGDPPAAPGRVSHDPTIASGDLIFGAAPPDRDAVKEGQGPSYSTQTDIPTASGGAAATGPKALHSPQRRKNRETIAIDAPLLMPTNIPLLAVPAGEPALPAVVDSKAEDSAAVPTGERNHPAPVTDAGVPAGLAHNIAASSQASGDHAQPRANQPDTADSAAPILLGAASAPAGDARSIDLSPPSQVDPKLIDGAPAAASTMTSGEGPQPPISGWCRKVATVLPRIAARSMRRWPERWWRIRHQSRRQLKIPRTFLRETRRRGISPISFSGICFGRFKTRTMTWCCGSIRPNWEI
jgi:hypothetical protein